MYWTRLVLVRPAASLNSASPLKHHTTGGQGCPNPDHYPDFEPASRSVTMCWALSRAAEPQILTSFVWLGRGSNHQPPACQANAQPLHYRAAVVSDVERWDMLPDGSVLPSYRVSSGTGTQGSLEPGWRQTHSEGIWIHREWYICTDFVLCATSAGWHVIYMYVNIGICGNITVKWHISLARKLLFLKTSH